MTEGGARADRQISSDGLGRTLTLMQERSSTPRVNAHGTWRHPDRAIYGGLSAQVARVGAGAFRPSSISAFVLRLPLAIFSGCAHASRAMPAQLRMRFLALRPPGVWKCVLTRVPLLVLSNSTRIEVAQAIISNCGRSGCL